MGTTYAYLVLMPATVPLASVNTVNFNHIGSQCLLAMTRSNTLYITINHILGSWNAPLRCFHVGLTCDLFDLCLQRRKQFVRDNA